MHRRRRYDSQVHPDDSLADSASHPGSRSREKCNAKCFISLPVQRLSESATVREQFDIFTLGEIWTAEGDEALARSGTSALRVSRPALSSLFNGKAALSDDMGLRIEEAFGVNMDSPMRMQSAYDIARTRKHEKEIHVRRIHSPAELPTWARAACGTPWEPSAQSENPAPFWDLSGISEQEELPKQHVLEDIPHPKLRSVASIPGTPAQPWHRSLWGRARRTIPGQPVAAPQPRGNGPEA
jgi:antitoxin HigA-1